jgi:Spy/CpxP family protein refolding chaperone
MSASREANQADRQRMQVLRQQLQAMRGDFDADKAQGIADEIGQLTSRMVFQGSKTWSEVYQLLDAEQRQELEALMKQRDQHRGKRQKGGEPAAQ